MIDTLATVDDVRHAGNYSERVDSKVLEFYLELTSFLFKEMIGEANYANAFAGAIVELDVVRLKRAEALLAVGFSLPAISSPTTQSGTLRTLTIGRTGQVETASFTKEVMELAANFINMGRALIPSKYYIGDEAAAIWSTVFQKVFPGLDELPTQATIFSAAEAIIQEARGDEILKEESAVD